MPMKLSFADRASGRLLRVLREHRQAIVDELASRVDEAHVLNPSPSTYRLITREGNRDSSDLCASGEQ